MTAGDSAVDAIFVLQANKIVAIEVEEISGPLIGGNVLLCQLQTHLLRIVVAGFGIVDGNGEQASFTVFGCQSVTQVGRESGNAALARQIVSNKSDARGQRHAAGFRRDGKRS